MAVTSPWQNGLLRSPECGFLKEKRDFCPLRMQEARSWVKPEVCLGDRKFGKPWKKQKGLGTVLKAILFNFPSGVSGAPGRQLQLEQGGAETLPRPPERPYLHTHHDDERLPQGSIRGHLGAEAPGRQEAVPTRMSDCAQCCLVSSP